MNKYIKLDNIYHLFWLIIHSIISLIVLINRFYQKLFKSKKIRQKDINILVNYLNKIPKHIAVCINEELLDCHQLSQLIRWCQQFGVTYVSLFSNSDLFIPRKELENRLINGKNGHKINEDSVNQRRNGFNRSQTNGKSNRLISFENTKVCVLSYEDSHQSLVKAAKHLCQQKQGFDQNDISDYLRKTFDFPDPEVLISFGDSPTLYGYPLWQLRLTEMYFLRTHRDFHFDNFYQILIKYSKCEQRFGK